MNNKINLEHIIKKPSEKRECHFFSCFGLKKKFLMKCTPGTQKTHKNDFNNFNYLFNLKKNRLSSLVNEFNQNTPQKKLL